MDPVSVGSGVQLAFQFVVALNNYVQDVKGAKEDLQKLVSTITATFDAVRELQELLIENEQTHYWNNYGVVRANKAIEDSRFLLQRLGNLVLKGGTTVETTGGDLKTHIDESIFSKLKWPYYKPQIREVQAELILVKQDVQTSHITYKSAGLPPQMKNETLQKLQQHGRARMKMMKELQQIRQMRLDAEASNSMKGLSIDDDQSEQEEASMRRSSRAEKALLMEWEEAVEEKLCLQRQLKAEEELTQRKKEEQIKKTYIQEKQKELQDHQRHMDDRRQELVTMLNAHNISPTERLAITNELIQNLEKDFKGDEFVRKVLASQGLLSSFTNLPTPIESSSGNSIKEQGHRRFRSWFSGGASASDLPLLLKDNTAPSGVAVLSASYFTPDPLGQFKGIEVEPDAVVARCAKAIATKPNELTLHFPLLPESCKVAIVNRLDSLNHASLAFRWSILLIDPAFASSSRLRSTRSASRYKPDNLLGAYAVYKRHQNLHGDDYTSPSGDMIEESQEGDAASVQDIQDEPGNHHRLDTRCNPPERCKTANLSGRLWTYVPRASTDPAIFDEMGLTWGEDSRHPGYYAVKGCLSRDLANELKNRQAARGSKEEEHLQPGETHEDTATKLEKQEQKVSSLEKRIRSGVSAEDRYARANETIYDIPERTRSPIRMGWDGRIVRGHTGPLGTTEYQDQRYARGGAENRRRWTRPNNDDYELESVYEDRRREKDPYPNEPPWYSSVRRRYDASPDAYYDPYRANSRRSTQENVIYERPPMIHYLARERQRSPMTRKPADIDLERMKRELRREFEEEQAREKLEAEQKAIKEEKMRKERAEKIMLDLKQKELNEKKFKEIIHQERLRIEQEVKASFEKAQKSKKDKKRRMRTLYDDQRPSRELVLWRNDKALTKAPGRLQPVRRGSDDRDSLRGVKSDGIRVYGERERSSSLASESDTRSSSSSDRRVWRKHPVPPRPQQRGRSPTPSPPAPLRSPARFEGDDVIEVIEEVSDSDWDYRRPGRNVGSNDADAQENTHENVYLPVRRARVDSADESEGEDEAAEITAGAAIFDQYTSRDPDINTRDVRFEIPGRF